MAFIASPEVMSEFCTAFAGVGGRGVAMPEAGVRRFAWNVESAESELELSDWGDVVSLSLIDGLVWLFLGFVWLTKRAIT